LEVVAAETRRRTGGKEGLQGLQGERMEGLESVFVTVRHDFGVMARLLADGYRIHHAAGGGTQVVLLRRFVKVEVPTAGTHICRSKVILFRRRKRGRGGAEGGAEAAAPSLPQEEEEEEEEGGREGEGEGEGTVEVFLFRRRAKGIYKMPGGHVELKELAEEAAVREVWEETGYACRVVGMVALTERKDVGKKWGCSQLMFTFAAEWVESEMRLDDAVSREGKWFLLEEVDAMVAKDSVALDPPLKKVWPAFRAGEKALQQQLAMPAAAAAGSAGEPAAWFCHHPDCIDAGYETRKRCYMVGGKGEGGREGEVQLQPGQQQQEVQSQQGGADAGEGGREGVDGFDVFVVVDLVVILFFSGVPSQGEYEREL
jgi:ADP-ribose pyrophosphatase YjhB (NUDIX family)